MIYLNKELPEHCYRAYLVLLKAITLATQDEIPPQDIADIEKYILIWIKHYEEVYYQKTWERLPATRSVFHMLCHVADCIQWAGPMNVYSQWAMERYCGQIARTVSAFKSPNRTPVFRKSSGNPSDTMLYTTVGSAED